MTTRLDLLVALAQRVPTVHSAYPLHAPTFDGPAEPAALAKLEAAAAAELPASYRDFLRECAGFTAMDVFNGYQLFTPDKILALRRDYSIPSSVSMHDERQPYIPIGGDGGGNLFLMGLSSGVICKWQHETGASTPIAESFARFLDRIIEDWAHFIEADDEWPYLSG
jgi:SMI1 / KNR4 family (SUKH-1)